MTEGTFDTMADGDERAARWAEQVRLVLDKRATGASWADCGSAVGWSPGHCIKMVREHATRVRAQNHLLIQQRYLEHDARLEFLYDSVARRIHEMANFPGGPVVDEKLVRAAVAVLDRQAKLHGLDAVKPAGGRNNMDWLDESKPIADVLREAEALGLVVPDAFRTVAGV